MLGRGHQSHGCFLRGTLSLLSLFCQKKSLKSFPGISMILNVYGKVRDFEM